MAMFPGIDALLSFNICKVPSWAHNTSLGTIEGIWQMVAEGYMQRIL